MPRKIKETVKTLKLKADGCKTSVFSDLLSCALYHDRHAREPLITLVALKLNFKEKKGLIELKRSIRKQHIRYARAIRSILSAR